MKTTIAVPCNDVLSPKFESKLDPFFTSKVESNRWGKYSTWDKDTARSALATKRPIPTKHWAQAQLGVSSPVRKY